MLKSKLTTRILSALAIFTVLSTAVCAAADFVSDFGNTPDRIWVGPEYWPNPMEDWRVVDGRLECRSFGAKRNVHALTHQLGEGSGGFEMSVNAGMIDHGRDGSVGFRFAIRDRINDYRGNCFFGQGIDAVLQTDDTLVLGDEEFKIDPQIPYCHWTELRLHLRAEPDGDEHELTLTLYDAAGQDKLGEVSSRIASQRLVGNIALVNNHRSGDHGGRFWFSDWRISGDKVVANEDQRFGPILWAMHTLSDSRTPEGHVMSMTAQMPPLGRDDSSTVELQIMRDGEWVEIGSEPIDPDARTATFRIPNWTAQEDVPYRLAYESRKRDGQSSLDFWEGTVRRDPVGRPVSLGALTCQFHSGFPYQPLVDNLGRLDPDVLYFSGDQVYEGNGGFGIIRRPADRAIINYLRKWYMFGWAFGDLMRDRPTICLPDDHDVFQGNLFGEGGKPMPGIHTGWLVGYLMPVQKVNAVHRTQTAHHPDFFDPTPTEYGLSVYYGDMVYGRISFGMVSDRQFKSAPHHVDVGEGNRPDHLTDPNVDPLRLDAPGLTMLGERQKEFLEHWVSDWRGADMKVLLTGTTFANVATHHGGPNNFLIADLDSGGWPQSARRRIIEIARKGRAFHVSGDQHLGTLVQHGLDEHRDAIWGFCTPAISNLYRRWWRADDMGMPHANRPEHGFENTGEYLDGLKNKLYMHAVANPPLEAFGADRYERQQSLAAGFGFCVFDPVERTIDIECYKFMTDVDDPSQESQYPGWPVRITQDDNDGRDTVGHLPEMHFPSVDNAVLRLYDEDGQLVYAQRIRGNTAQPWVYSSGTYSAALGDPDTDEWEWTRDYRID